MTGHLWVHVDREVLSAPRSDQQNKEPDPLCASCYSVFTRPFSFEPRRENRIDIPRTQPDGEPCRLCHLIRHRFGAAFEGASSLQVQYRVDMRQYHLKAHDICFRPVGRSATEVRLALQPMAWTGMLVQYSIRHAVVDSDC